jgi:Asp-tRNA(Asn)/Glu-tRNA(Gln) amidotransferase A subunit family amidase
MQLTRREILRLVPAAGIASTVFARALAQQAAGGIEITREMIAGAKWVSDIELTEQQEEELLRQVQQLHSQLEQLRAFPLDPLADAPATIFTTGSAVEAGTRDRALVRASWPTHNRLVARPSGDDQLAFLPVDNLAELIRGRQISSRELTQLYLGRLKKYDPMLLCVVNLTEELAMQQADKADRELACGRYRGLLHGIPWGAKDLISVPGYPTTWGIPAFRNRVVDQTATVAKRLEEAGAVLIAKLSLGALAMGDRWFRGRTRNPWNPEQGSSGSSAGSACAVSAGLVGFALGSETLGSIVSPSIRCATHGLRPSFGRVSRDGCMPLSWSMDKVGPLARSTSDLATILAAIQGPDGKDPSVVARNFVWPPTTPLNLRQLRVGITRGSDSQDDSLKLLRSLGCQIREIELPDDYPLRALTRIIDVEAAAVFDDLLRKGDTEGWNSWTQTFQTAQFVTAIDYLRMQRVRRHLMTEFEKSISQVDLLWNSGDLVHTNLTGHPSVVLPVRFDGWGDDGNPIAPPRCAVVTGHLFQEEKLLAFAEAVQRHLPTAIPNPPLDRFLEASG